MIHKGVATAAKKIHRTTSMKVNLMKDVIAMKLAAGVANLKLNSNPSMASQCLTTRHIPYKQPCDATLMRYMRYFTEVHAWHPSGINCTLKSYALIVNLILANSILLFVWLVQPGFGDRTLVLPHSFRNQFKSSVFSWHLNRGRSSVITPTKSFRHMSLIILLHVTCSSKG